MQIEVRADNTTKITGYVNVTERESLPVITARGKVNEQVERGVFQRALEKGGSIAATIDHDETRTLATTADGGLKLTEDNIGLRAELVTDDAEVAKCAREGKIKGWSFGMKEVKDRLEERADRLPLRHIRDMVLDHVTLVIHKKPCYSATSVEVRAGAEEEMEIRAYELGGVTVSAEKEKETVDYSSLEERIKKWKGEG